MKTIVLAAVLATFLVISSAQSVFAAPNNSKKAENNPKVVAYYPEGLHAIPADPIFWIEGTNLVMKRGNSNQIQAWYTGEDGHGVHTVWNVSKDGTCNGDEVLIADAYPTWGDYLAPDTDYCVNNNEF